MITTIYNLIPKWAVMALCAVLLVLLTYTGIKMEYFKIDNAKLSNDNKILKDNAVALQTSLDTCAKSLKAEADNFTTQATVTAATAKVKNQIANTNVKENINATTLTDAIRLSNSISGRLSTR